MHVYYLEELHRIFDLSEYDAKKIYELSQEEKKRELYNLFKYYIKILNT